LLLIGADALSDPSAGADDSAAGSPAATDLQSSLATGDYFSSARQAFSEDFKKEVVRIDFIAWSTSRRARASSTPWAAKPSCDRMA
jgi:hypothetical protein